MHSRRDPAAVPRWSRAIGRQAASPPGRIRQRVRPRLHRARRRLRSRPRTPADTGLLAVRQVGAMNANPRLDLIGQPNLAPDQLSARPRKVRPVSQLTRPLFTDAQADPDLADTH